MDFQALIAAMTKLKVDLTTLRSDIGVASWGVVAGDALQAANDAHALVGMVLPFLATWFTQPHAKAFAANATMTTMEEASAILDSHIEAANAGTFDPTKFVAFLLQLVPLILTLFAKPAPTPAA